MKKQRIALLIESIGLENYQQIFRSFQNNWPQILPSVMTLELRKSALHQLKGISFSIGLDDLGKNIADIEDMIANGAEVTASMYLKKLENRFIEAEDFVIKVITEHQEIE